ncbi:MAG: LamG-like jellyroll fold domain-containing protein [Planctomycetota bacterium]
MTRQLRSLLKISIFATLLTSSLAAQTAQEHGQRRDHGRQHGHDHEHVTRAQEDEAISTTREGVRVLAPPTEDGVFHFAIYGDRTGGVPAGLRILEQAVTDTNLLDPDLVMTVGDLIQGYNEEPEWLEQMQEYKAIMDRLNMSWFPVAGNHDVYWRGNGPAPAGHHESNYETHFGPLWYSFEHKNAGFIILYSDEGDPESNEKGFRAGRLQTMSDEQLAFLHSALEEHAQADHVFVFLHHPRWIGGGYEGGNWDAVHDLLKAAGNVSAVFAGHIHRMRYDGPTDGIEYFTLATTGGGLGQEIPGAGTLHHLNLVTVREDRFTVATIPIGAVIDPREFTTEFIAEIDSARSIRPLTASPDLTLEVDGSAFATMEFKIENPCPRPVEGTVSFDPMSEGTWRSTLGHQHFRLEPGGKLEYIITVARREGEVTEQSLPAIRIQLDYIGESSRVELPEVLAPLGVRPGIVPVDFFQTDERNCLLSGNATAAAAVASDSFEVPDGPMTIETWVYPLDLTGYNAMIAKTQSSEYALFSDEGVPQFDIHLNGTYVTAAAQEKLPLQQWSHVAGVYDGENVAIYVNGRKAGQRQGSGTRQTNGLPLFIGADPDGRGRPTRGFNAKYDEVRISSTARYQSDFSPQRRLPTDQTTVLLLHFDRRIGPFLLDQSSSAARTTLGPESQIVPSAGEDDGGR